MLPPKYWLITRTQTESETCPHGSTDLFHVSACGYKHWKDWSDPAGVMAGGHWSGQVSWICVQAGSPIGPQVVYRGWCVSWSQNCLLCVAVKLQGIGSAWCWIIWLFYMEGQFLCLSFMHTHTHSLLLSRLILVSVCQIAQSSNDVKTWTPSRF